MDYEVDNRSAFGKAFKVYGGIEVVPARTKVTVACKAPLTDEQVAAFARDGVTVKAKTPAKKADEK